MNKRPFTLIEILTVIVIITILLGLVMGGASVATKMARKNRCKAQLTALEIILEQYYSDWGFFPEADTVLELNSWATWYYLHLRKTPALKNPPAYNVPFLQEDFIDNTLLKLATVTDTNALSVAPVLDPVVGTDEVYEGTTYTTPAYHDYFVDSTSGDPYYFVDPYGQPFYYQSPGTMNNEKFDLWSKGNDQEHGEAGVNDDSQNATDDAGDARSINAKFSDDINNWTQN